MYEYSEVTLDKLQHRFDKFDDICFICNGDLGFVCEDDEDEE